MRRLEGLKGLSPGVLAEPVCAVGVFDGVHRGHRQLLYELRVWAKSVSGEACVITFPRHPLTVLKGIEVPAILTLENRLEEFEREGVEAVALLDFEEIRDLGPAEFVQTVLVEGLGCKRLLMGFDSRIGKNRRGTPENLPALARRLGVEVRIASPVFDKQGAKIGSRFVRDAIGRGDLAAAANALGRPYCLRGEVVHGSGRGKGLGAATANVAIDKQVLPPDGVYLVRIFRGAETAPAIANLGVRPTFGEGGARHLEVHVPGWTGDHYGEVLEVRLVRYLRPEAAFEGVEELRAQIARDLDAWDRAVAQGEI